MDKNDIFVLKDILDRVGNNGSIQYHKGLEYDENGDKKIIAPTIITFKYSLKHIGAIEMEKLSLQNTSYRVQFFFNEDIIDNIKGGLFIDIENRKYTIKRVDRIGFYKRQVLFSVIVEEL